MANTASLDAVFDWVRSELAAEAGVAFAMGDVRRRTGKVERFNAGSSDGRIVATITNSSGATSGGKRPSGEVRGALAELSWLSLVDAPTRFLVVTNPDLSEILDRALVGALAEGLSVRFLPLTADLAERARG